MRPCRHRIKGNLHLTNSVVHSVSNGPQSSVIYIERCRHSRSDPIKQVVDKDREQSGAEHGALRAPQLRGYRRETLSSICTETRQETRNCWTNRARLPERPRVLSLRRRPWCQTVSKARLTFRNTAKQSLPVSNASQASCSRRHRASRVE